MEEVGGNCLVIWWAFRWMAFWAGRVAGSG